MRMLLAFFAWMLFVSHVNAVEKGNWNFSRENREHPQLEFVQDRKVLFYLGVGRAYGLHIACPGPRHPDGPAKLTISTPLGRKVLRGEFTDGSDDFKNPAATYFLQWDMGFDRSQEDGMDKAGEEFVRFLNFLASAREITIDVDGHTMVLPRVTVANLRTRFGVDTEPDPDEKSHKPEDTSSTPETQ